MSLAKGHDEIAVLLGLTMSERKSIDRMTDEEFVSHRARILVEKNKLDAPFVINPVQWLTKVAQVESLLADADSLRERAVEAENRAERFDARHKEWRELYETTLLALRQVEADRDALLVEKAVSDNTIRELREKLSQAEQRASHLKKVHDADMQRLT